MRTTFDGPMRLREGLVHSRNFMTIRVVRQLGVDAATQCTAKFGFDPQDMPKDLTLALGSLPVTPLQMVSAYAVFANGGYRVNPYFIDRIEDASGKVVYQAAPKVVCERCDVARPRRQIAAARHGATRHRDAAATHCGSDCGRGGGSGCADRAGQCGQSSRGRWSSGRSPSRPQSRSGEPGAAAATGRSHRAAGDLAAERVADGRHDGRRHQARHR